MSKVAVVYWSGTGNTKAMADAVEAGAAGKGAEVTMFGPSDFTPDKVSEFNGIAFGCPAMGAEVLEETEYEPMFSAVEGSLSGKAYGFTVPEENDEVIFTNNKDATIDTGINLDFLPYLLLIGAVAAGVVLTFRRRREV